MGLRTFVNEQFGLGVPQADSAARPRHATHLGIDVPLLLATVSLVVFGVLMVYSASADFSYQLYGDYTQIFRRQMMWLGLGIVVAIFLAWMDYHFWKRLAIPAMLVAIVALLLVLFLQEERLGAVRSLFSGSVQPSELAKVVMVIYLSVWLYNRRDRLDDFHFGLFPLAVILGLVGGFILLQPDLSAVITVALIGVMMFFLAGGKLKQLIVVMLLGTVVSFLVLKSGVFPTGLDRWTSFWKGLQNPLLYSDHVQRSLEAFIKGGFFGVGIGKSETKLFGLPFPHTDSVFAVVGEETGVLGAAVLVVLYMILMWRGLAIARRAPDCLGSLLAAGLAYWVAIEACINMAVMVGLMPFAGNALPFISAGGSSLVVCMAAVGVLMNISRVAEKSKQQEERSFNAVVDLRRRDGRRRVPRAVRSAVPQERRSAPER
ncbi:MAG: cell division protein FtsW [Anaerolineales bacterium]|nr:cell division protein FtsW [Anaerolineales bacterium]